MTRTFKFPTKIALSFCTLFCLWPCFVFSQQVDTAWVRRYNGTGNEKDSAIAIAVDSTGSVYVTGSCFDRSTRYDYTTIKYFPNGNMAWVRQYDGPANDTDLARDMVLDANANIYITGVSQGNITTIKYDSNGNELWVRRLTTAFNGNRSIFGGYALGLDGRGNLYVTGQQWDLESWVWFLIKYDTTGGLQWTRPVDLTLKNRFALAIDSSGNVYVAAGRQIVKYDSQGGRIRTQTFSGTSIRAINLDENGNLYATGVSPGTGFSAYATAKYDSTGNQIWFKEYPSSQFPGIGADALAVDKKGNVYITGSSGYAAEVFWVTIKYDSLGNQLWIRGYYTGKWGKDIVVDSNSNVYVAGLFATVKYDSSGNQIWFKDFSGAVEALAFDKEGSIYATGYRGGHGTGDDYTTIKYSPIPQIKGDLNLDGALSTADVVLILNCAFMGEAPPAAPSACDLNCDGKVTPADVVILLNMVFASAIAPC